VARVSEDDTKHDSSKPSDKAVKSSFSLGGLLGGLGGLIEKLGELAEAGEELSRSGELKDASGKIRGVYGINVKTGLGDRGQTELKVEPFGNVRRGPVDRPWARTYASRWLTFTKRTTTCWSWSNSPALPRKPSI
jgi:hypothetical protein